MQWARQLCRRQSDGALSVMLGIMCTYKQDVCDRFSSTTQVKQGSG